MTGPPDPDALNLRSMGRTELLDLYRPTMYCYCTILLFLVCNDEVLSVAVFFVLWRS